jgi:hypothetical protein
VTVDVTPGGAEGHMWRVWLTDSHGRIWPLTACSKIDTLSFVLKTLSQEFGIHG